MELCELDSVENQIISDFDESLLFVESGLIGGRCSNAIAFVYAFEGDFDSDDRYRYDSDALFCYVDSLSTRFNLSFAHISRALGMPSTHLTHLCRSDISTIGGSDLDKLLGIEAILNGLYLDDISPFLEKVNVLSSVYRISHQELSRRLGVRDNFVNDVVRLGSIAVSRELDLKLNEILRDIKEAHDRLRVRLISLDLNETGLRSAINLLISDFGVTDSALSSYLNLGRRDVRDFLRGVSPDPLLKEDLIAFIETCKRSGIPTQCLRKKALPRKN